MKFEDLTERIFGGNVELLGCFSEATGADPGFITCLDLEGVQIPYTTKWGLWKSDNPQTKHLKAGSPIFFSLKPIAPGQSMPIKGFPFKATHIQKWYTPFEKKTHPEMVHPLSEAHPEMVHPFLDFLLNFRKSKV